MFTPTVYWPMVESSLGIVGACLPLLKPIVSEFGPLHGFISMLYLPSTRSKGSKGSSQNALMEDSEKMEEGISKTSLVSSEVSVQAAGKTDM